jgi:hypothetical protein
MAMRKEFSDEVAKDGQFSEVKVERFRSEKNLAQDHVIGRNRRVGELLCQLSLIQGHGLLPANARVSCRAARFQDYESSGDLEAAHYLPGQVLIARPGQKERDPSCYVNDPSTKNAIGALFSRVQNLPVDFNKADSYVEQYTKPGLKAILAAVCQRVIRDQRQVASSRVSPFVYEAYAEWIAQSLAAYRYGINRKIDIADVRENPVPPATAPAFIAESGMFDPHLWQPSSVAAYERAVRKGKSGQITATVWNYSSQIRILGYYAEFTERDTATLNPHLVADIERAFKP